jgi:hypothetical protein
VHEAYVSSSFLSLNLTVVYIPKACKLYRICTEILLALIWYRESMHFGHSQPASKTKAARVGVLSGLTRFVIITASYRTTFFDVCLSSMLCYTIVLLESRHSFAL